MSPYLHRYWLFGTDTLTFILFNTIGPVWYNFPDESSMETDELPLLKQASYNLTPLGVHYVLCFVMYCVIWKFYFLFLGCISNTSTSFLNNFFLLRSAYLIFACIIIICREWSSLYPSIQGKTNIIVILLLYIIFWYCVNLSLFIIHMFILNIIYRTVKRILFMK